MASVNLGRVAMVHRGDYNLLLEYKPLDCCYHQGSTYLCKAESVGNAPPNTTYWVLMSTSASTVDRDAAEAAALAAQGSASTAATQVSLAAAQVTLAQEHADDAAGSAATASGHAIAASGSADLALASAGDADVSAGAAADSALAAAGSADAAAISAASVDGPGIMAAVALKPDFANLPRLNILHNGDFRNPVNQRGVSGTISAAGYFLDRWMLNSGSVTIGNGLVFASGATIEQRIEGHFLIGETVTLSVQLADGSVKQATGVMPGMGEDAQTLTMDGFGSGILGYNANYLLIRLVAGGSHTVLRVKLEVCAQSTLGFDPPMDHAIEANKCRRFYIKTGVVMMPAISTSETLIRACFTLPVAMRVSPTLISVGGGNAYKPGAAMTTVTDISVYQNHPTSLLLHGTTTSLTAWQMYQLYITSIELSSDL